MAIKRRGKLAYKILFWFLLLSMGPMFFVGWHLVRRAQESLRKETLAMQESLALGFADTVSKYLATFRGALATTSSVADFAGMNPARQRQYLDRILQVHPAVLELSVLNARGVETLRAGRFLGPKPEMRDFGHEDLFEVAMGPKGQYVGRLERFQGLYPTVTLSVPILDQRVQPARPVGVLAARVSLNPLSTMLASEFPPSGTSQASVVSRVDGFLIADSDPKEIYRPDARLSDEVLKVLSDQSGDTGGGELQLPSGQRVLAAYAQTRDPGWMVYIQQPAEVADRAAAEMESQILRVMGWMLVIVVVLSWVVAGHITHPIRVLKEAADRLGKGQFESPEVVATNDEIGDLAHTFLDMSESLKEKTGELVGAKQELEKFTKFLEKRVDARTRELKAAQDELIKKERLAAIGQMASVVGHEIRNPLAVINNSIYFIKTKLGAGGGEADPKLSKHIKIIESEIQQANGIINEILTYSRQRELKPERVQLNGWLSELLSVYPFPPHVSVEKQLDPADPAVDIDTAEMQQAVRNLIGNAVEVMPPPGGGKLTVRTAAPEPGWVRVDIADTGTGIPPEVLDKIFAPFFTTKARGTGLGLAVVRKAVDHHKGRVDVESRVGVGTTFKLYLPRAA